MTARKHWSTTVRLRVWERFGRKCQMCQQPTDERGYDLDHHIPLAIGGDDEEVNLRPLCRPCHRLKTKGDVTQIAKTVRQGAAHAGARAPSRNPLPGSKRSPVKRKINGQVVDRATGEIIRGKSHV